MIAFASGGYYYPAFTIVLVAGGAAVRGVGLRSWRPVLEGGAVAGTILALSLVTAAPSLVYSAKHGRNDAVPNHQPFEGTAFRLKQLVLPIEQHRIGELAKVRKKYDEKFPPTEAAANTGLGIVAGLGFLWLLLVCFVQLASPGRQFAGDLAGRAGVASLLALMFGLNRGVVDIRRVRRAADPGPGTGCRSSSGSSGCSLPGLRSTAGWRGAGALAARFCSGARCARSGRRPGCARPDEPDIRAERTRRLRRSTAATATSCGRSRGRLPAGSMIFQLPHRPFPEAPPLVAMSDYDLFRGYLHSRRPALELRDRRRARRRSRRCVSPSRCRTMVSDI